MEGRQQPTLEELLNKITFLSKALEFYSSKKSYACHQGGPSPIDIDRGHQARFALEQIEEIKKFNQNLMNEFKENIESMKNDEEDVDFEELERVTKVLHKLKEYGDKNF